MKTMFPVINHINDVLPWIKDKPEIIMTEKEHYTVLNYVVSNDHTFDSLMARECRGIKFDENGYIIARPFHKFHNINQIAETQEQIIAPLFDRPHIIMNKLDGSMVHAIMIDGSIRLCTKMGITSVAEQAEEFLFGKIDYQNFIIHFINKQITPIFEWTSRKQQIVLDYPEDNLILTALRFNVTGDYYTYDKLWKTAEIWGIPVVGVIDPDKNIKELIEYTKNLENEEGFVVRFENNLFVKCKADWYCLRHNSRDLVQREFKVVQAILNEEIDDLKPMLLDDDINKVEQIEEYITMIIRMLTTDYEIHFKYVSQTFRDRKTFATSEYAKFIKPERKSAVFAMWDGRTSRELVIKLLKKHSFKEQTWADFKESL